MGVIHWNANCKRPMKVDKENEPVYHMNVVKTRLGGQQRVKPVRVAPRYDYLSAIVERTVDVRYEKVINGGTVRDYKRGDRRYVVTCDRSQARDELIVNFEKWASIKRSKLEESAPTDDCDEAGPSTPKRDRRSR